MDEAAIRQDLEAIYRKRYIPMHEEALRVEAMSDDEYFAMVDENIARSKDFLEKLPPAFRSEVRKRRTPTFADLGRVEAFIQHEVEKVLPFLLRLREVSGVAGPVSEKEASAAAMDAAKEHRAKMAASMQERLAESTDAGQAERIRALLENLEATDRELEDLRDDPSEEKLKEFSDRITARIQEMSERIMKSRRPPED